MKILVTGSAGLLGAHVASKLSINHEVVGTYHNSLPSLPTSCNDSVKVDLSSSEQVTALFKSHQYDQVINCTGASDVDRCERDHDYATRGNVSTVANLIACAKQFGFRLLHISSDYVFDGENGPTSEGDEPHPLSFYGETKLKAEQSILESGITGVIVRVCSLYSTDLRVRGNIYSSIVETILSGKIYRAATDLYSNPTDVADLADAIAELITHQHLPKIIHLAAPEYLSRYQFAVRIAEALKLDLKAIQPIMLDQLDLPAKRPKRAGLNSELAVSLLGHSLKTFSEIVSKH